MNCNLFTIHYSQFTIHYSGRIVYCNLFTIHCSQFPIQYSAPIVNCKLWIMNCKQITVHYSARVMNSELWTLIQLPSVIISVLFLRCNMLSYIAYDNFISQHIRYIRASFWYEFFLFWRPISFWNKNTVCYYVLPIWWYGSMFILVHFPDVL